MESLQPLCEAIHPVQDPRLFDIGQEAEYFPAISSFSRASWSFSSSSLPDSSCTLPFGFRRFSQFAPEHLR
jgi:hypothetical protein